MRTKVVKQRLCYYLSSLVPRHNNQYTRRMKSQGPQIMSIFINKTFYHCSLFYIALVRTGDLLSQCH